VSTPFVYIGTIRLKEGKLDAFERACAGLVSFIEANEPRLIAFNVYANEDGTEVSVVQIHPDADSMVFHMQLLHEHISAAGEDSPLDVTTSNQVYGTPNETVLELIKRVDPGVPLIVKPNPLGGFTRSAALQTAAAS
jgi:quinol monooxygenase YgiN